MSRENRQIARRRHVSDNAFALKAEMGYFNKQGKDGFTRLFCRDA